ncbi:1-acyl-sn-glycerol-3-phosphate acyltransferase 1, chloroplastic-like [Phalaenopsis equestris]|uniref:1-acyl-sn-glycerol-3-phosphate acyltransferase 1, chloroplastic-like n=1 Tax=Phalaenopsis equestris TaxID=78828 RepID=UPI0009E2C29E|nr:1-acyl-sn-glycerol-3-phosphate acyltransferase 1, chloroplastic-like [Phalaenopsis equestris]XP_020577856.1 1-acyl-sn-glycerol-3-phosphate acyltransferase 1, chloroplastic-like [Phalaenopsis equestris]XP_020577857.1 1-acyl-sn-glycerol-3-phosphate acyltransferase 1, chloroplastic-like [Phalaenopsis equestris]XP_020577858.1 1-acyl-sn-glycerol-3-phosphate acyltransferase 1, chloroplastic-like [Phalaenopsis equestris]XP_020577859.1 1-acyl-sn-glycerol-3-phosphate acyltransferase 1, chloroplastic-
MDTLSVFKIDTALPVMHVKGNHSIPSTPQRNCSSYDGFSRYQFTDKLEHTGLIRLFPLKCRRKIQRNVIAMSQIATASSSSDDRISLAGVHLGSKFRGICFYAVTAMTAIPLFVLMMLVHPFVMILDRYKRRVHHTIAKIWATLTISAFYRFEFEGLDNLPACDAPAVYVSNHQSFLDTYTLLTLGRCFKFISKTSIFLFPIIGWAMFLMGLIPLRRMDSRSQLECLKRCMDCVRKGASVFFFPEGTRSKDGKLGAFKKGAFTVAAKTEAPVVPITLLGTRKLMPAGMEGILNSGSVKVVIHKPLEGKNAEVLRDESRRVIADTLISHGYGIHNSD